ncbi:aminodeoxychorismate lyase [Alteromonas sp. CYL-A6]|uniref:aminodeoxychorismate lyase n=1 Tax=Alteromonas nitratireducens TaxID=3390813 RepID=UPI0034AD73A8
MERQPADLASLDNNGFAVADRAANYGDGVFSTMQVVRGNVALLSYHVRRLLADAGRLGISVEESALCDEIRRHASAVGDGVLKILVSAGVGGRGYSRGNAKAHIVASYHALPEHYAGLATIGMTLTCASLTLARQPALAGIKHLNRLEQVLIKQELAMSEFDDALVCDSDGCVTEASAANVFWLKQGQWFTPELDQCGVAGVMRQFVLDCLNERGEGVQTGHFSLSQCLSAEHIVLTNALMQLMPVRLVRHHDHYFEYDCNETVRLTDWIREAYAARIA